MERETAQGCAPWAAIALLVVYPVYGLVAYGALYLWSTTAGPGGWAIAATILAGPALIGCLAFRRWSSTIRGVMSVAIVAVGVVLGVHLAGSVPPGPDYLRGLLERAPLPTEFAQTGIDSAYPGSACFDACPSLTRAYCTDLDPHQAQTAVLAAYTGAGFEVEPVYDADVSGQLPRAYLDVTIERGTSRSICPRATRVVVRLEGR